MTQKSTLLKKWLDNELPSDELALFKEQEDYAGLLKLTKYVQHFKPTPLNTKEAYDTIVATRTKPKKLPFFKKHTTTFARIAAVIALSFGTYFYTTSLNTIITTHRAQKATFVLPDTSIITLNATSTSSYNKRNWENSRTISLDGEAFFKVAKGKKFTVNTPAGNVTVLGTAFNVKQRENYFEVVCYEGTVRVDHLQKSVILHPQDKFLVRNKQPVLQLKTTATTPSWTQNKSSFTSAPFKEVLNEFERQYHVTFQTENISLNELFTGAFEHTDKDVALKTICIAMGIKQRALNSKVILLTYE